MSIGTGALGQYAIGQSQTQAVYISVPLVSNTSEIYSPDIGHQYITAPLVTNSSVIYQRASLWATRAKQTEVWIERDKQSETWTRAA